MPGDFFKRPRLWGITVACLVIVALAVGLWWQHYTSPRTVFADMLINNLTTSSVTKSTLTSGSGQKSLQQANLQLGATNASTWSVTVEQGSNSVTTESIGTKDAGFVRYTDISANGNSQKYSKVLGIWAKDPASDTGSSLSKLFGQSLLDIGAVPVPPIGDINAGDRANMLAYIRGEGVFTPDYKTVKTATVNGRRVYVYKVAVALAPYLRLMQDFGHMYGLTDLDSLSPSDYQSAKPVDITLYIDVTSHQMLRVGGGADGFSETYSDYGLARTIIIPTHTITTTQLQQRLSSVQ